MGTNTMGNLKIMYFKEKVFSIIQMEINTKDNFK